jgi:hypothetical protein
MDTPNLWQDFKMYFAASCDKHHLDGLERAWRSGGDRTTFYVNTIFPEVADQMNLTLRRELFKVDAALCKTSDTGHYVPHIFIESENNADTATYEMWKLASLNSPCRILIVCCEWSSDLWGHSGRQDELLKSWSKIIKAHSDLWKLNGVIGIINVEWGEVLRLTSTAWNENGQMIETPQIILELA